MPGRAGPPQHLLQQLLLASARLGSRKALAWPSPWPGRRFSRLRRLRLELFVTVRAENPLLHLSTAWAHRSISRHLATPEAEASFAVATSELLCLRPTATPAPCP